MRACASLSFSLCECIRMYVRECVRVRMNVRVTDYKAISQCWEPATIYTSESFRSNRALRVPSSFSRCRCQLSSLLPDEICATTNGHTCVPSCVHIILLFLSLFLYIYIFFFLFVFLCFSVFRYYGVI